MRRTMAHLAVLRITLRRPDGKSGPVQKWLKVVVQLLPMWRPKAAANHDQPVSRDAARGYRAGGLSDAPICLSCVWCRPVPEHGKWRITQLTTEFSSGIRSMGFMMYLYDSKYWQRFKSSRTELKIWWPLRRERPCLKARLKRTCRNVPTPHMPHLSCEHLVSSAGTPSPQQCRSRS